jgi:uncharacterized protein (DUF433 family)
MASAPAFEIVADPVPLKWWDDGSIRVAGTRVRLDTVIEAFNLGETPETIAANYGQLPLSTVYSVLAFYLSRRQQVDKYLETGDQEGERTLAEIEREQPTAALRERLKSRAAAVNADIPR